MIELRGIGWGHARAMAPLLATAEVWADLHPDVRIAWERRSLWSFGEQPLDELAANYDLLVIDHPMVGYAATRGLLAPVDLHVERVWLEEQARLAVGASHRSYEAEGRQWAAATDAACQVAASRPDLLRRAELERPASWREAVELARATRRVALPLSPIDAYSSFLTLCANQGEPPLRPDEDRAVSRELGLHVLGQLRELAALVPPACFDLNPIGVLNAMSTGDDLIYCPHTFGYTNYAREGYAPRRLAFHDLPPAGGLGCAGSTLGGAGLAVSASCVSTDAAFAYLRFVAEPECQRTTYVLAGGQPGNAAAWDDELADAVTGGFFRETRRTIESAFVRPTHAGMESFQTPAARALQACVRGDLEPRSALDRIDALFRASVEEPR